MTNEELVEKIQNGERELIPELWAQVERFIYQQAWKRARAVQDRGGATAEDLYHSGFLAMVDAVERYDSGRDMTFIGLLSLRLKSYFAQAGGYRYHKQSMDPMHSAVSLNTPIGEDGGTMEDVAPDPVDPYEEVEERLWREQLRVELDKALDALPTDQAYALRRKYFYGETLAEISTTQGVGLERIRQRQNKGLRTMRKPVNAKELRQFIERNTAFFMPVSVGRFTSTGTSAVEALVLRREELEQRYRGQESCVDECRTLQNLILPEISKTLKREALLLSSCSTPPVK